MPPPIKWTEKVDFTNKIDYKEVPKVRDTHPNLCTKSPIELFDLYYNAELKQMIIAESIRYARQKNNMTFQLDEADLDVFIGILLFSGYHSLPRQRLYWSRDEDVNVSFVSSHMSRNRFDEIKKYIHLADNDKVDANDKLYKVRTFISALNTRFPTVWHI
jgi:hypothetical protein